MTLQMGMVNPAENRLFHSSEPTDPELRVKVIQAEPDPVNANVHSAPPCASLSGGKTSTGNRETDF